VLVLRVKRVYSLASEGDGFRILVDRLWPRGVGKDKAKVDLWIRDIAPSDELRGWFAHKEERWQEFKRFYFRELEEKKDRLDIIVEKLKDGPVTLLYGAKNTEFNNAVALKEYIQKQMKK
jgi:uncharacterized protein YeaO (DUF488 family)